MKKIVFFTGAGISQESGIDTFRGSDGLWEGMDVMSVASIDAWHKNRSLMLDFYNKRRKELSTVQPNKAHDIITSLQNDYDVVVVTQNVDDLHEKSGTKNVIHLHGELTKMRGEYYPNDIFVCDNDIKEGDLCPKNSQLRPHVVWFGEDVPNMSTAIKEVKNADYLVVVGTSLNVYPAAFIIDYISNDCKLFNINPEDISDEIVNKSKLINIVEKSTIGMEKFKNILYDAI